MIWLIIAIALFLLAGVFGPFDDGWG